MPPHPVLLERKEPKASHTIAGANWYEDAKVQVIIVGKSTAREGGTIAALIGVQENMGGSQDIP